MTGISRTDPSQSQLPNQMKLLGALPIAKTSYGLGDAKTKPLSEETMDGNKFSVPATSAVLKAAKGASRCAQFSCSGAPEGCLLWSRGAAGCTV